MRIAPSRTTFVENCTITDNFGLGDGAGVLLWQNTLEQGMQVTNCILRGNGWNDFSEAAQIGGFNEILAINHSNIQGLTGALGGVANIDEDPLFVSDTDLRLSECSPCINAGDNSAVTASTDLDWNTRIVSGVVDMGAYEALESPVLICQPGTFSATGEAPCGDECQPCPVGTFQPTTNGTVCYPCGQGTFAATTGAASCSPCPLGLFQSEAGGTECLACDPGTLAAAPGAASCSPCPADTFQPDFGSSECVACGCDDGHVSTIDSCDAVTGSCQNIAVPAASAWSLICLALLLLSAATILMPRALEGER